MRLWKNIQFCIFRWLVVASLSLMILFCFQSTAFASAKLIFADNFSSHSLVGWKQVQNAQHFNPDIPCQSDSGGTYSWQVIDQKVVLVIENSPSCQIKMIPNLNHQFVDWSLPPPLQSGFDINDLSEFNHYKVEFAMHITWLDMDRNWLVSWTDENNYLAIHLIGRKLLGEKVVAGQSYPLTPNETTFAWLPNTTYQIALEYNKPAGEISIYIDGERKTTFREDAQQPQLPPGLPGLAGSVGLASQSSTVYFDDFKLWQLKPEGIINLQVPLLKQNDLSWGENEYDQASQWVGGAQPTTISRWGCALTSLTMLLNYYGYQNLPEGIPLNPGTLNDWLNQQPEGYLFQGWLNWRVIGKLTQQLSQASAELNLPVLEFSYESISEDQQNNWLSLNSYQQQPSILQVPSHFVVHNGYDFDESSAIINDPLFEHQLLTTYDNQFISARVFQPSQTDISGLTVAGKPGLKAILKQGEQLFDSQPFLDQYLTTSDFTTHLSTGWWVYDWPKLSSGDYKLLLSNPGWQEKDFVVLATAQTGEPTLEKLVLPAQTEATEVPLNYQTGGGLIIDSELIFDSKDKCLQVLSKRLSSWLNEGLISSPFVYQQLAAWLVEIESGNIDQNRQDDIQEKLMNWQNNHWLTETVAEKLINCLIN